MTGPPVDGFALSNFQLPVIVLSDATGAAFASDALPLADPDPADFALAGFNLLFTDGATSPVLHGSVVRAGRVSPDSDLYSFSTGTGTFGNNPTLAALLTGDAPQGSFKYDSGVFQTGTLPAGGTNAGAALYFANIDNLVGSVNGLAFAGADGLTVVGNERFEFPSPGGGTTPSDVLILQTGSLFDPEFSGFEVGGYTLSAVLVNWIEGNPGIDDFLSDETLPTVLPDVEGLLTLVFRLNSDPSVLGIVDFIGLRVILDMDVDTVADADDNCPTVFNPNQSDVDRDGVGNLCDDNGPPIDIRTGRPEKPGPPFSVPPATRP